MWQRTQVFVLLLLLSSSTRFINAQETDERGRNAQVSAPQILTVQIEHDTRMRPGNIVRARTVYPLYVANELVVPVGAEVLGRIAELRQAPRKVRTAAEMGGDFTPLHSPKIEFDRIALPGGQEVKLNAEAVTGGVQVVRFQSLSARGSRTSLTKKLWAEALGQEKAAVHTFTAPDKAERARRMLYMELPYHPELLMAGTQYSIELSHPLQSGLSEAALASSPQQKVVEGTVKLVAALTDDLDSKHATRGCKVHAVVTEPLYDEKHQLKVPQGSELVGEVTQVHPAGKWGKGGTLRFSFRELKFPAGFAQKVHGSTTAVDAAQNANLQIDAEGGMKPGSKGIAAPLLMGLLAASAIHEDEVTVLHTGGASNGFALVGRVAALAAKSNYVGAAFGFYGTGRAVYSRYLAHGKDVEFPKNTRIEVMLEPERVNALAPPK
jgi:hypothetical protein